MAIDYFGYDDRCIGIKTYFTCRARERMYQIFESELKPTDSDEVLDLGATPDTTLASSNFFEQRYPYKDKITVASIEDCTPIVQKFGLKAFVLNRPKERLPFADKAFDILVCSAVLEHVGTREDQGFFLKECLRVSRKVFLTTPYRYFPIEMHTSIPLLHWLPWTVFQKAIASTKNAFWADINNLNLFGMRDMRAITADLPVTVSHIRTLGMRSNLIVMTGAEAARKDDQA